MNVTRMFRELLKVDKSNTLGGSRKKVTKSKSNNIRRRKVRGGADDNDGGSKEPTTFTFDGKWKCDKITETASEHKLGGEEEHTPESITKKLIDQLNSTKKLETSVDAATGTTGGAKKKKYIKGLSAKAQYKRILEKYTLLQLQKMAKAKNIKISTKKNKKISYIKKESLVNKIVKIKFPSKK